MYQWHGTSRDAKYSRIHRLPWHGTSQESQDTRTPLTWDVPGWPQESRDTKYSRIHWFHSHGTSRDHPRNPGILSIPGSMDSPHMGHPGILSIPGLPHMGSSQESWDTKYSRIHSLPWHGTSRDGPRNHDTRIS